MRIESSVTSISWIPSEAVEGSTKVPFELGVAHYDAPPPDHIDNLEALREADRFRFANELRAWIDVEDGRITGSGYSGSGHIGSTTLRLGGRSVTLAAVSLPDKQVEPAVGGSSVRFVQTAGGRTGAPAPRRVSHPPYVQIAAPLAWTTLSLTIFADGTSSHDVVGASPFPRHWIYNERGDLSHKSGLVDFNEWMAHAFGKHTPWGDEDSPALVTEVETALERELSTHIMRGGAKPRISTLAEGRMLMHQGDAGKDVYLLLDGVLAVDVDGQIVANVGPGAVLGERALLEGGLRTATLTAATKCRVAAIDGTEIDPELLQELAGGHKREAAPA
ncbi:MAG: cyclic nucleotide-binding domain-containing protein [Candidatus Dormibacteraeota bacterium]|nr:cyclic nucleotide-binding domain-containing protein [Candidatus Dormibacteraeota bacterium]